jgi:formate dehydrogenase subunit delta
VKAEKLVQMANQIGDFFASLPDARAGAEGVATHLRRFWEPRMRAELLAHAAAGGAKELSPLVREAVEILRKG